MSIIIKQVSYIHPDKETLFQNISFSVSKSDKIALIGNNGSGKSTLLRIIAKELNPSTGEIVSTEKPYYIPQHFGQYNSLTVAQAIGIDKKIGALDAIIKGDASMENFTILDDDWNIEERAFSAFSEWGIDHISLNSKINCLSGGEKTKVFLSGITIHSPAIILLDEPSNHLDMKSREQLYDFIKTSKAMILVVTHDRTLLNLLDLTYELNKDKIEVYGGNYEFYKIQKEEQLTALEAQLNEKEKQLRQSKKIAQEAAERKQRQDARGHKKQVEKGAPRICMKTLKNKAEASASKLKEVHSEKLGSIADEMKLLRHKLGEMKELKLDFENSSLHKGKILVNAKNVNFGYTDNELLWENALSFQIKSGERVVISGLNGSGKTTLLKLILGKLNPIEGELIRAEFQYLYVDQEYSIINNHLTVFEQVQEFNARRLLEHELKMLLHHYLFSKETWDKTCEKLSGGEKMKLIFCCMMVSNNAPDIFVLDEPTNNLDIESLEIVTSTIRDYKGTVLVISHDQYFINEINIEKQIIL